MPLHGEALTRSLGNSPDTIENYIAVRAVTRQSTDIAHLDSIPVSDRINFAAVIIHNWLQLIPGYVPYTITSALGFDGDYLSIASEYGSNALECIKSIRRQNEHFCGGMVPQCPVSLLPNMRQNALLQRLGAFVVEGGRREFLARFPGDAEPADYLVRNQFYPLQLNVDIGHVQNWYGLDVPNDNWCTFWLQNVASLTNVQEKLDLCHTTFDFGLTKATASRPSTFVSTDLWTSSNTYHIFNTFFSDKIVAGRRADHILESVGGWVNRRPHLPSYRINVTRLVGQYAENAFADIRGRSCGSAIYRPRLHPYDRWASEALVADDHHAVTAQDSEVAWAGIVIFIGVSLLLMVLGALITYSCSRYRERRALRDAEPTSAVPTTLQSVELQSLTQQACGRY
jgi:hypothetical protein